MEGSAALDYSPEFYRAHAGRYAEVAHQYLQSRYLRASHPELRGDTDLLERLKELAPGKRGLDAGCGAGARDVYTLFTQGYDVVGVDAIEENIAAARKLHPEITDRVFTADLRQTLPFEADSFDFVLCNAVIQHITPPEVMGVALPGLVRVLRPGGVLQLMFKVGQGIRTVYDRDYLANRTFHLYGVEEVVSRLQELGLGIVPQEDHKLGGILFFTDPKPMEHCVLFGRKETEGPLPS